MNCLKIFFYLFVFVFYQSFSSANNGDPFTKNLGQGGSRTSYTKPVTPQTTNNVVQPSMGNTNTSVAMPSANIPARIGNILAPDPLISYELTKFMLKGTALSSMHKMKNITFNREGHLNKIDYGNIPTTHLVNQNDTLESIARRYGYSPDEIKVANSIVPGSKLIMGTRITLPARVHVVQKGQSLDMIAEIYNVDVKDLVGFNNLLPEDELKVNEKLLLPFYVYKTDKIKTISEVAQQFNRTTSEVLKVNGLSENQTLDKNQYVKIPIFVNPYSDGMVNNKMGIVNYSINPKNLAIIEINGQQFMVKEGDRLGNNNGRIVKITATAMTVLENFEEYVFQINAPIVQQMVSLPSSPMPTSDMSGAQTPSADGNSNAKNQAPAPSGSGSQTSVTNVEDLFK